jgi:hypothetical protein
MEFFRSYVGERYVGDSRCRKSYVLLQVTIAKRRALRLLSLPIA